MSNQAHLEIPQPTLTRAQNGDELPDLACFCALLYNNIPYADRAHYRVSFVPDGGESPNEASPKGPVFQNQPEGIESTVAFYEHVLHRHQDVLSKASDSFHQFIQKYIQAGCQDKVQPLIECVERWS